MTTQEMIAKGTDQLVRQLGIEEQVIGMTCEEKLANMAIRFARLSGPAAPQLRAKCMEMSAMARKYGC